MEKAFSVRVKLFSSNNHFPFQGKHLVRAVSTLLKLTKAEEKFLLEMLEWRNSWFRSRPNLPKGENL